MNAIVKFPATATPILIPARKRPTTFWGRVKLAFQVARERRELASLNQRMLDDIGLTPEQAGKEVVRAPWDLPIGRRL